MQKNLIAPAYAYHQFSDDPNIVAFFQAYNSLAQDTLSWMIDHPLALYINDAITGGLLTYCAYCLYGQFRYKISYTELHSVLGAIDSTEIERLPIDKTAIDKRYSGAMISDDLFKRVLTWNFYKGDGFNFSIPWLKRRVMRFLTGDNGHTWRFNHTTPVRIQLTGRHVTITIDQQGMDETLIAVLNQIISNGILNVPSMVSFSVAAATHAA